MELLVEQIKGSLPPAPPSGKGDGPEVMVTSIQKLSRKDSPSVPLGKQGAWKYGKVTPHGDVFEGKTINGQQTFWDGVGLRYYNTLPEFVRIGGVEMVCRNGKYLLRRQQGSQGEPVGEDGLCRPGLRQKDK
nr:hypothetical protein [Prevotella sp.]